MFCFSTAPRRLNFENDLLKACPEAYDPASRFLNQYVERDLLYIWVSELIAAAFLGEILP